MLAPGLAAHLGAPGHTAGDATGASAKGRESLGGAHVPGSLGHLELLGVLVRILGLGISGGLLILMHPLLVSQLTHVFLFNILNKIKNHIT